jgi:hypothetical protein
MAKINRLNIGEHLLEYQLNMIGKTMYDARKNDIWFIEWTMTDEQHDAFKAYAIPLMKKVFKINKTRAEANFQWFDLQFGLRVKD